jgi:hypothetical protein
MNELDVAKAIAAAELKSPQMLRNAWKERSDEIPSDALM